MTDEIEKRIGECGEAIFDFHYGIYEIENYYIKEKKWEDAKRMIDTWVHGSLDKMAAVCKVDVEDAKRYVNQAKSAIERKDGVFAINSLSLSIGKMLWEFKRKKLGD